MPYLKVWIHLVFSTKNRFPFLEKGTREKVFQHIKENAKSKDIFIKSINGYVDHVHVLFSLKPDQSISKVAQLIKGESSFWVNKNNMTKEKFEWQEEYFAVSVSESAIDNVVSYIENQEAHHSKKTFQEEYLEFVEKFKFQLS
ncbi:MAG: IS200/IS605 family transposase [Cyclobacteriaceae bacterium]